MLPGFVPPACNQGDRCEQGRSIRFKRELVGLDKPMRRSPHRLVESYKLALEPDGSPLFTSIPLVACWRYEPREHPTPLAMSRPAILPSPLRDRVGYSDHDRFRGYFPVH